MLLCRTAEPQAAPLSGIRCMVSPEARCNVSLAGSGGVGDKLVCSRELQGWCTPWGLCHSKRFGSCGPRQLCCCMIVYSGLLPVLHYVVGVMSNFLPSGTTRRSLCSCALCSSVPRAELAGPARMFVCCCDRCAEAAVSTALPCAEMSSVVLCLGMWQELHARCLLLHSM